MARTMSDEQEAICRAGTNPIWVRDLIAELDAERAAHEVTKARLALAEVTINTLDELAEHDRDCIRSRFSAGRPVAGGGYECCYGGEWYESRPVDRTPACTCGLTDAIAAWRAAR